MKTNILLLLLSTLTVSVLGVGYCPCPNNYNPVCGSDFNTYYNECYMRCENSNLYVIYYGRCDDVLNNKPVPIPQPWPLPGPTPGPYPGPYPVPIPRPYPGPFPWPQPGPVPIPRPYPDWGSVGSAPGAASSRK